MNLTMIKPLTLMTLFVTTPPHLMMVNIPVLPLKE